MHHHDAGVNTYFNHKTGPICDKPDRQKKAPPSGEGWGAKSKQGMRIESTDSGLHSIFMRQKFHLKHHLPHELRHRADRVPAWPELLAAQLLVKLSQISAGVFACGPGCTMTCQIARWIKRF